MRPSALTCLTMTMATIELRNGLHVTEGAIVLAVQLEARGHLMQARDGKLVISNGSALSAEDRAGIVRDRLHLLCIASYEAPEPRWPSTFTAGI